VIIAFNLVKNIRSRSQLIPILFIRCEKEMNTMLKIRIYFIIVIYSLGSAIVCAQGNPSNIDFKEFIPKWSQGDNWILQFSGLDLPKSISTRDIFCTAKMTVIQTPSESIGNFVFSIVPDPELSIVDNKKLSIFFITIDQNNLSLLSCKKSLDPNDTKSLNQVYQKGNIMNNLSIGMMFMLFPVLTSPNDVNDNIYYDMNRGEAIKASIINFEGEKTLSLYIVYRAWTKEDFVKKLKDEKAGGIRLLWKKGDPWWSSQTSLPGGVLRTVLIKKDEELSKATTVNDKFEILYSRFKNYKSKGDQISADESYYKIFSLGKKAIPDIVEKIKEGDKDMIPALSEISGSTLPTYSISDCLKWWERVKEYWLQEIEKE
jgi:hypothetical protein